VSHPHPQRRRHGKSPSAARTPRRPGRRPGFEALEDRLVLSGLYYLADGQRIDLSPDPGVYAVKLGPDATPDVLDDLTAPGGPLAGFTVEEAIAPSVYRVEARGASLAATIDPGAFAYPDVEWLTPAFSAGGPRARLVVIDELVVGLKPGVGAGYLAGLSPMLGKYQVRPLLGTPDQFVLNLEGRTGESTLAAANALAADPNVAFSVPNFYQDMRKFFLPNDPLFPQQWHLNNTGTGPAQLPDAIAGADVRAVAAWDISTGAGVTIAVVDDGMERTHPDLAPNMFVNPGEVPGDGIDNDGNGYVDDVSGWSTVTNSGNFSVTTSDEHATSVAGIAAARGDNGLGVAGMAFNARILPVQIFNGGTYVGDAGAATAIYYAAGRTANGLGTWNAAQVINCSWGGGSPSPVLTAAFTWASNTARGGLGVATFISSGNDYESAVSYPANLSATLPGVMAVGATNQRDTRSEYSNYGTALDFVTPSSDIDAPVTGGTTTTDRTGNLGYNAGDYTNNTVANGFGGTSSASPLAAGIGALVLSVAPGLSAAQVRAILRSTADKVGGVVYDGNGFNLQYGHGRLNARRAVEALRMCVIGTTPPNGAIVATPPAPVGGYRADFNFAYDPDAADIDLTKVAVNGINPTSFTIVDADTLQFGFATNPVAAQGLQSFTFAAGAVRRLSNGETSLPYSGSFRYDATPLAVTSTVPPAGGAFALPGPFTYDVNFNEPVAPASVSLDDLTLGLGTVLAAVALDADTVRYTIGGITTDTTFTIGIAAGKLTDAFGNPNVPFGASYSADITTVPFPVPLLPVSPLGSLVYTGNTAANLGTAGDRDSFTISVDPGQLLTIIVDPAAALAVQVNLFDGADNPVGAVAGPVGADVVLTYRPVGVTATTTYRIQVSSPSGTTGGYALTANLNAAEERESRGGPSNDTTATAQDLDPAFTAMGGAASRAAVLGTAGGNDYYAFTANVGETVSLALQSLAAGVANVALLDPSGAILATAVGGAPNVGRILNNVVATTSGVYRALVTTTTTGTPYNLLVLRNAAFDREPNNDLLAPQDLFGTGVALDDTVLGYVRPGTLGLGRVFVYEAFSTPSNRIREISPQTGAILNTFPSPTGAPFSPDGALATTPTSLLVGNDADGRIFELNPNTGAVLRTITTTIPAMAGLAFLNNEIYVQSDNGTIFVLNYATGAVARSFPSTAISESLAASTSALYGTNGATLFRLDTATGAPTQLGTLSGTGFAEGLGIVGDELFVADGSTVRVYNLNTLAALRSFTGFTDLEAIGADGGVPEDADWYSVWADAGNVLEIRTSTPAGGAGEFVNLLDPRIQLYGPADGLLATGAALPDGRNELITWTALVPGRYRVRVSAETAAAGEYVLAIGGNSGSIAPAFRVVGTAPAEGAFLRAATTYVVDLNDVFLSASVQASDLRINGVAATSVAAVDGDTLQFTLPAGLPAGVQAVTIAAGAILDVQGTPIDAFTGTFTLDTTGPRVTATSVTPNGVVAPGNLSYQVTFSEPMLVANILATGDFTLRGNLRAVNYNVASFAFNAAGTVLTLNYANLPDDDYTLTLTAGTSGGTNFTDLAGNALDGEFAGTFPSGNGVPGGNFVIGFDVDLATEALPATTPRNPRGGLIFDTGLVRTLAFATDVDEFTINLDAGQSVTLLGAPTTATLQPRVELVSPANVSLGIASGPAGQAALLQTAAAATAGTYRVLVSGNAGTLGLYTLQVFLNAAMEAESRVAGVTNNTPATAQDLNGSFLTLATPVAAVARAAVLATTDAPQYGAPTAVAPGFTDISATGTRSSATGDDGAQTLSSGDLGGFAFPFFGTAYTSVSFSTNGLITFGGEDTSFSNSNLSTSPSLAAIAVLWDDLFNADTGTGPAGTAILWQVVGSGPGAALVVQWNNVTQLGGTQPLTFQAVLGADGSIRFHYGNNVASGVVGSSTVGIKAAGTANPPRTLISFNQAAGPLVGPGLSTRIAAPPPTGPDVFSFTLDAADTVGLAVTSLTAGASVNVQLIDALGSVLVAGVAGATNTSGRVENFGLPLNAGTYFARVAGDPGVNYSLVVTRNAAFDREANNTQAAAQPLGRNAGALGHLTAGIGTALNFTEVPTQPANGLTVSGVTFGYTIGGVPSTEAVYNAAGPGTTTYTQDPALEGNAAGVLTMGFATPVPTLQFGLACNATAAVANFVTVALFDAANNPISTSTVSLTPGGFTFASGQFSYAGPTPVGRVVMSFNTSLAARFVLDNLVLGRVESDWYSVALTPGANLMTLRTDTPAGGPGQFANGLAPVVELYSPAGALVASGLLAPDGRNQVLEYLAPTPGLYAIRVTSAAGTTGEYLLTSRLEARSPNAALSASLAGLTIDNGTVQRSRVRSLTVDFNGAIALAPASAFRVTRTSDGLVVPVTASAIAPIAGGRSRVTLTFGGPALVAGSLPDGNYTVAIDGSQVFDTLGAPADAANSGVAGSTGTFAFHRFFGDSNGDGLVDATDFLVFRAAYLAGSASGLNALFDADGNGVLDAADHVAFMSNFRRRRL
jgi:hypothetical protein